MLTGACVECLLDADCPPAKPVCSMARVCGNCRRHSDCASGICNADGSCVAQSDVAYVNADSAACMDTAHTSTPASPYCNLPPAVSVSGKSRFVIAGATNTYGGISLNSNGGIANWVFVGPGRLAPAVARVNGVNKPAIELQYGGTGTLDVRIDGLVLSGIGTNGTSVTCTGGAPNTNTKLLVQRSDLRLSDLQGLKASNCDVVLDGVAIHTNLKGGIELSQCDFTIVNALVYGNGGASSDTGGITTSVGGVRKVIANVTIVNNVNSTGSLYPSGLACTSGTLVFNALLFGNTGGTEIVTGNCNPKYSAYASATDGMDGNRAISSCVGADLFVGSSDFHLNKTGGGKPACVMVDKGTSSSAGVMAPAADLDGTSRPQGATVDIGAYESM